MADGEQMFRMPLGGGVIAYDIGMSGQRLVFTADVLSHFHRHRQTRCFHRESGGQLFATFDLPFIVVQLATGPRATDRRTRWSYFPNRKAEQAEILELHHRGLHYIGDWHSHPEPVPRPSGIDKASITECVRKSRHGLNAFALIIVGQAEAPEGLLVAVCDEVGVYPLSLCC